MFLQCIDAVGLAWGADTMPVKQKHDHHGTRILLILNHGEGNGKPPRLKFSIDMTSARVKPAVMADYCGWVDSTSSIRCLKSCLRNVLNET